MLSKTMAVSVCLLAVLASSCSSPMTQLPIATPESTSEIGTAQPTSAAAPSPTGTLQPIPVSGGALSPQDLGRVKLLHQYWLAVATAAEVDPYAMDISVVASSPDGRLIAVGGCSKQLATDLRSGGVFCNNEDPENPEAIPFLLILDADTENVVATIPENEANTTIADLAFTPDGQKLIYAVHPGKFVVWDVALGSAESLLWEGESSTPKVALSPDGKWIALKTTDQLEIWDTVSGEFVTEIPADFRPQFSADSQRILVYYDREFVVYETGTWTELVSFATPCDCVYALSPDFSLFATSERAASETEIAPILIWDTSTGEQIQSLEGGVGSAAFLLFSPDGRMLWRAGERGDLTAWDTRDWQLLAENIGGITPIFNLREFQFDANGRRYLLLSDLHLGLYGLP